MESKVTITRRGNQKGSGVIAINITDQTTGMIVVEVEMSLAEFGECITGMGACTAEMTIIPNEFVVQNLGKKKELRNLTFAWKKYGGDVGELHKLIEPHLIDGWMIWSDGLRTQQNGKGHNVTLYRFVALT